MIDFDDSIRAFFFCGGRAMDWMAGVNELPDGTILTQYRFRYDHPDTTPDEPNSDRDKRSWYEQRVKPDAGRDWSVERAIALLQMVMDQMQAHGFCPPGAPAVRLVRGALSHEAYMSAVLALPWMRVRKIVLPGDTEWDDMEQRRHSKEQET